jgi:aspartyl-tRNA(Asn)/glutamyl-tRNA(Gln) amidotransferase subunit A
MTTSIDTRYLTIREVGALLRSGQLTSETLTRSCLDLVARLDDRIHAFVLPTPEVALLQARESDAELAAGKDRGPLHGIPIALKDLYATKGIRTTAHSRALIDWVPEEDSACAELLREAGTVLLGKLAMHEFAFGVHDPVQEFPQARNPWNTDYVTGGSSTGSGAALAAGFVFGALGSDTGGSIRNPGAICSIVGLKPTFGRVSRRGVVPLSWSLDHAGPMARTVEDTAYLMQALAGYDPRDDASSNLPAGDYLSKLDNGIAGMRLGLPRDWLGEGLGCEPEVLANFEAAIEVLKGLGATIVEVESEPFIDARATNSVVMIVESYAFHEELLKTHPEYLSTNVRNRVREGAFVTGADYVQAQRGRVAIRAAANAILQDVDFIVSPSQPSAPQSFENQDWTPRYSRPNFSNAANTTGFPAISVPSGFTSDGLPLGLQVMGRAFDEAGVLQVARAYEQATDWHTRHPAL